MTGKESRHSKRGHGSSSIKSFESNITQDSQETGTKLYSSKFMAPSQVWKVRTCWCVYVLVVLAESQSASQQR